MGKWNHRSRFQRPRSPMRWYSGRQYPSSSSVYNPNDRIPVWEKKFCEVIGSVPWQKVVEFTTFKCWYDGIVINWDDSACEETFHNEKKRFWSQFNGFHCDIPLPDPDLYISEVDWDTSIDPELIRDLEEAYSAPPDNVKRDGDKNSSDCNPWEPVENTFEIIVPWGSSVKVRDFNEKGKKPSGWNLLESSSDHRKDWSSPWEGKPSFGNERRNESTSRGCLSNGWETDKLRENVIHGNNGWDNSEHQNKKTRDSESIPAKEYAVHDNPWEGKPSYENETAKDAGWRGCSGNGWGDSGWGNGGWGNNQVREMRGYNRWNDDGFDSIGGANAGGWQTQRGTETRQRNWDAKRSNDGWGRPNNERDDFRGYRSGYKYSRPGRDDHHNRKVKW